MSSCLESHPLQLDTDSCTASVLTLSPVDTDVKESTGDTDSPTAAAGNHGACLTLNDHDHIRQFIQEFAFRGLLPHIEKNIRQLNDQVKRWCFFDKTGVPLLIIQSVKLNHLMQIVFILSSFWNEN